MVKDLAAALFLSPILLLRIPVIPTTHQRYGGTEQK